MSKKTTSINKNVLDQIKSGKVKMRPSVYFSFISLGIVLASLVFGLLIAYSSSVMFFWIKILSSGSPAYGARRNMLELLASFPWWAIIVLLVASFVLVYLVRIYGNVYRHKISSIFIIIIITALISGFIMSLFGVGDLNHGNFSGNRIYLQSNIKQFDILK